MLFRYLRHLQTQPKHVRDSHAFFVAVGITGIVALLWLVSLPGRLEPVPLPGSEGQQTDRPLMSLYRQARDQVAAVFSAEETATTTPSVDGTSTAPAGGGDPLPTTIKLSPEELDAARAAAAVPYVPPATTTPRKIRIATTTTAVVATTSATTSR